MPRHSHASVLALLLTCCACALPSSTAAAESGGGLTYGSTEAAPVRGDAGTLLVRTAAILGRTLRVRGTMAHGEAGRPVSVQRQAKDGTWIHTASATTSADGAFDAAWKTDHIGRFRLRAVPTPSAAATASAAAVSATGETQVTVYRQAVATFYGPGLYGKQTACGQTLRKSTLGVAHRTLPCGTLVSFYAKGQSITVPVIDRGPFREGTTWDLTSAAAEALDFTATGTLGALRLPTSPAAG